MVHTKRACIGTYIKKWGICSLVGMMLIGGPLQGQPTLPQGISQKKQTIGKKSVSFTIAELEALGASTLADSVEIVTQIADGTWSKDNSRTNVSVESQNADIKTVLSTLSMDDIDRIEISEDGQRVKYHILRSITKDGVTAEFSFRIIDNRSAKSTLDPIVSAATKIPVRSSQIGDIIRVIEGDELETLGVVSIEEVFTLIGDASFSSSSGVGSLFFRGSHSGATKVLYNGVDLKNVTGTNGAPLFELIPVQDIERIEIISGSSSTMQGSNALGGVISITTKQGTDGNTIQTLFGPDQYQSAIKATTRIGNADVYFLGTKAYNNQLSAQSNPSYSDKDAQERQLLTIGITNQQLPVGRLSGFVSRVDESIEIDGFSGDLNKTDNVLANINYSASLHKQSLTNLTWSFNQSDRDYFTSGSAGNTYRGKGSDYDVNHVLFFNSKQTLLFGLNYYEENGSISDGFNNKSIYHKSIYSQYRAEYPLISTQIGFRYEDNSQLEESHAYTYDVALFKEITVINGLLLKATQKTGLRTPTLYELEHKGTDIQLEAEKSLTREISCEQNIKNAILSVTIFDTKLNNKIAYDNGNYFNVQKSNQNGVVLGLDLKNVGPISFVNISRSHIKARDNSVKEEYGNNDMSQSLKVPQIKNVIRAGIFKGKWRFGMLYVYEDSKKDYDNVNISSYDYMDLSVTYQVNQKWNVSSKIHNVFNEEYQKVNGYLEPRRTIYIGTNYQF